MNQEAFFEGFGPALIKAGFWETLLGTAMASPTVSDGIHGLKETYNSAKGVVDANGGLGKTWDAFRSGGVEGVAKNYAMKKYMPQMAGIGAGLFGIGGLAGYMMGGSKSPSKPVENPAVTSSRGFAFEQPAITG